MPFPGADLSREGHELVIPRPWAMARFDSRALSGGWWTFECEGEGDLSGVEVRVSSPRDPLIVFPGAASIAYRVYLPRFDSYDIALLSSAWPGRIRFARLKLRRLSMGEEANFLIGGLRRLVSGREPFRVAARLAQRLFAGQSVGIAVSRPPQKRPEEARTPAASATGAIATRIERKGAIEAVLGCDDRLHPEAFEIVAAEFERSPAVQAAYSDVSEAGVTRPHPAWDAELAKVTDFVGLPVFFRSDAQTGAGDAWSRLLRISESAGEEAISRIPLPLAQRNTQTACDSPSIPPPALDPAPRVSVIVPTKFRVDLLEKCLEGLVRRTGYPALQLVLVDNGCEDPRFGEVLAAAAASLEVVVVEDRGDFNFSRLINNGVRGSSGEVVVLLNDDVTPVETGWLHRMVQSAMRPEIGAVGARLTYPDGTIQHAGVLLGVGGVCGHMWKGASAEDARRNPYISCPSSRLAVTGACLAVRRTVFDQAGGLDEAAFPVAFNDIDFCLRLRRAGLRTIYRGDAVLIHHESQSRGPDDASIAQRRRLAVETAKFFERWKSMIRDDPFSSPAFDPLSETGAVHRTFATLEQAGPGHVSSSA